MTRQPPPQSAFSAAPGLHHDRHLPGSRRQRTRPYIHVTTARSSATTASWPKSASTCTPMPHSSSAATSSLVEPPQLPSPPHRLPQPTRYLIGGPGWSGAGPAAVGTGVLPLSVDDPGGGAKVTCGSRALVTADKGNDPPQNGRGLTQAWVRGPARPPAGPRTHAARGSRRDGYRGHRGLHRYRASARSGH